MLLIFLSQFFDGWLWVVIDE